MDARNTINARHNAWIKPNITIVMVIILTDMVETTAMEAERIIPAKLTATWITMKHLGTSIVDQTKLGSSSLVLQPIMLRAAFRSEIHRSQLIFVHLTLPKIK
jgi:hypothetical protein